MTNSPNTNSRSLNRFIPRKTFTASSDENIIPDLISLQRESYSGFLQYGNDNERDPLGIQAVFESFFPLHDNNNSATLEFVSYSLSAPKYTTRDCLISGRTFSTSLKAQLRLILWNENEDPEAPKEVKVIKEQEVYLCDVPLMTQNGSFVINGSERVIVSQMRRAPGVFFDSQESKISGAKIYTAKIIPQIGSWLDFEFDNKDILHFRIDKKRKIPASTILKAIGMSSGDIVREFYSKTEIFRTDNGWAAKFDYDNMIGKRAAHDIIDAKTKEVKVEENTKINRRILDKLKEQKFTDYLLDNEEMLGFVICDDLIDEETGEVLFEAGNSITPENLEILDKLDFNKLLVVNPGRSDSGPYLYNTLAIDKNKDQEDALFDIYRSVRSGETPASLEIAQKFFESLFFNDNRYNLSEVGRMKMNHRLNLEIDIKKTYLTHDDILQTVKILNIIKHNDEQTDDIDNLANRRVRSVGELVENQLRIGMSRVEKSILEKLNTVDPDTMMPQSLINAKPLMTSIKDFFATSQLSQFMDQTNPLAEITHKRRLSALGPGGLTRERASFEVRDVHTTHYGRICPIETPEGPNIGLINSLATYARINKYGFIETPYYKVVNGVASDEVHYLSALQESGYTIAQARVNVDQKGKIVADLVSCRKDGEFVMVTPDKVDFIDVSSKQLVSIATTLIPFLENDDANRALMGSNMQRQAVPLLKSEAPLVGTGMEAVVAADSGCLAIAKNDGVVKSVESDKIVIETNSTKDKVGGVDVYSLSKYIRSNQDTCINQKPLVHLGQKVKAGDVIADGQSTDRGELALGKNVRVAFMPWNGYNFEDSILISERVIRDDVFTSIHIEEYEAVARDTRLGPEEITRDIPNVNEEALRKLDENGIIHIGAEVKTGDILVGKTTPKSESPMTPEEKLLKVIFGEKASDVKDSSLYVSPGVSGTVIDVKIFSRKGIEKDERSVYIENQLVEKLAQERDLAINILKQSLVAKISKIAAGQKLKNDVGGLKAGSVVEADALLGVDAKHMNKISVAKSDIMDQIEKLINSFDEKVGEITEKFNEDVVKARSGDELSHGVLKIVKVYIASKYRLQPGDKMAGRHGNKGVVSKIMPIEDMPHSEDGQPVDIALNPLGVPSRMNVGQILETHLGWASVNLGKQVSKIVDAAAQKKAEVADKLRTLLNNVYSAGKVKDSIAKMNDDQIVEFAAKLKDGVAFSTGVFDGIGVDEVDNLLELAGVDKSGQITLIDGRTGDPFDRKVTVGYIYMLKLHHLVDSKIHARSIGPYSLITQQPLGGKSHFGGQRFGEMECWAMQAYGAAYSLQEMLTVKSDDVVGRIRIYESIIQGNQNFACGIPESFNVMIKEVRSLGLNIELIKQNELLDK